MKKLSLAVVIATLGLAAPALAQTPADIRNNRGNSPLAAVQTEVKIERTAPAAMDESAAKTKKSSKKSKKSSKKHSSKKHSHKHAEKAETKTETKTEEKK